MYHRYDNNIAEVNSNLPFCAGRADIIPSVLSSRKRKFTEQLGVIPFNGATSLQERFKFTKRSMRFDPRLVDSAMTILSNTRGIDGT
jgi:hypothetical protein